MYTSDFGISPTRLLLADFLLVWGPRSLDSIRFADVEEWHKL